MIALMEITDWNGSGEGEGGGTADGRERQKGAWRRQDGGNGNEFESIECMTVQVHK